MNKYYVYVHRKNDTDEIFYVGKGCGNRAYKTTSRSKAWKNFIKNDNYSVEIIYNNLSESEAFDLESSLILEYKNSGIVLCNKTNGGEGSSGRICTIETRLKLKNFNLGRKDSEETKRKKSLINKGKKLSEYQIKSLKLAHTGKKIPQEMRDHLSKINTGKKLSIETKQKISESNKGKKRSQETIEKYRKSRTNVKMSEQARKNMSIAKKNSPFYEINNERLRNLVTGRKWTDENTYKRNLGIIKKGILNLDNNGIVILLYLIISNVKLKKE